jgi:hypothetical protein
MKKNLRAAILTPTLDENKILLISSVEALTTELLGKNDACICERVL